EPQAGGADRRGRPLERGVPDRPGRRDSAHVSSRRLPAGFLVGCATAAHQVEGGTDNDWTRWAREHPERIADGRDATVAIDHYRRYRDDLAALGTMRHNAHRFSIEWSRVEPEDGHFDGAVLRHYADVV